MTEEEARALVLALLEKKLSEAVGGLRQLQQSRKTREELTRRLDALQSLVTPKPKGRPATWKGPIGQATVELVEAARLQHRLSIIEALRMLRMQQPWCEWWAGHSEAELQTRYGEALRYWQPIFNELDDIEATIINTWPD